MLWQADLDPCVLRVRARPAASTDPEAIDFARLAHWATIVRGRRREHIVLSDGWHRIRLDVVEGSLGEGCPAKFDYILTDLTHVDAHILSLRRMAELLRTGRFAPPLYPIAPDVERRLEELRIGDAMAAGASYREMAVVLFGETMVRAEWGGRSDFLKSRVRRLAREARRMAHGGWRALISG